MCDHPTTGGMQVETTNKPSGFGIQFLYLLARASKNAIRNPLIVKSRTTQTVVISLIVGFLFFNTGSTVGQASVQNRSGVMFLYIMFGGEKSVFTRLEYLGLEWIYADVDCSYSYWCPCIQ
ncbi:hypothetical protein SeLEV6574_g07584 [Synchytrium endobioticum]|uniref:ABC-2 type transporter transmembrane domain-containing protein n=1 Tax=Synchytrium endobioticum TaxID=286115 RepID=A0A507CH71_9FUNG|nr:hypothetical protein SeLEV6574_g07584 [Synchytrium endobioticum]